MKAKQRVTPTSLSGVEITGFSLVFLVQWFFNNLWSFGILIVLSIVLDKLGSSPGDISEGYRAVIGLGLLYAISAILSGLMTWVALLCYKRATRKWLFWVLYLCFMAAFITFTGWMFQGIDRI